MRTNTLHTFHIPVMGIGFTIDTPIRVAAYGINSVVSIVDDIFIEKMRRHVSELFKRPFRPIETEETESRSKRITAYLNLLNDIVHEKFEALKKTSFESGSELTKYFELLPQSSFLKKQYREMLVSQNNEEKQRIQKELKEQLIAGDIDVNIMTKVDKVNHKNGKALPQEFNDAHAALKGFAQSKLESSIVFSAGLNPRLMDYVTHFNDFFPEITGKIRKRITLKVSDFRSALIQGKFLAKKGLWVSEYRIESGLNCGGHAFATDGFLMGPILEEFKSKRKALIEENFTLYVEALRGQGKNIPERAPVVKFSAQGGVGTAAEHTFLLDYYQLDSIGWGSPFLLVPEATNLDAATLELVRKAEEKDLYLSNISPLGIAFNNIRGNTKDLEKEARIRQGKPGSPCVQHYLVSDTTFTTEPLCTASRKYQAKAIKALQQENLSSTEYQARYDRIVEKACICVGLSASAILVNDLETTPGGTAVSICPGPNIAYFNQVLSLREMVDHIYGRRNVIGRTDRPHMFIKELGMYVEYLKCKIGETTHLSEKQLRYFKTFEHNLKEGVRYYQQLFLDTTTYFAQCTTDIVNDLKILELELQQLKVGKEN